MILCVTLNPCLDKTLTVPPWHPGQNVRGSTVREVVGGKGNNVARALARLGRTARPVTFLGGPIGTLCEDLLRRQDNLDPIVTPTAAPTRTILTVRTGESAEQTAFFDPDPAITEAEAAAFYHRVEGSFLAEPVEAMTLSGSSPSPNTHGLYSDLIALAKARKVPVFLDTYGPALDSIWGFWPDAMQANRHEVSSHIGKSRADDDDVANLLRNWSRHGVRVGIITDGPAPAIVLADGQLWRVTPPAIDLVNPIGSGDSLVAGLADGWLERRETESILRRGFACAVANAQVWDAGAIDPLALPHLEESIQIERLGS